MARSKRHRPRKDGIASVMSPAIVLSLYFMYLLLRMDPKLVYQAQEPVFFFDAHFVKAFLRYPGGVSELLSAFLSQFFYYSWTGALLLVLVFGSVAWSTHQLMRSAGAHRPIRFLHWIPSVLLLALHNNYQYPLALTLGLLCVVAGANVYSRLAPAHRGRRFLLYALIHSMLYYVTAGQAFVFLALIVLHEVLYYRRVLLAGLYVLFAGCVPYVGASTLFILHAPDAYTMHLTSLNSFRAPRLLWLLYALFPLVLLLVAFEQRYGRVGKKGPRGLWGRFRYGHSIPVRLIHGALLLSFAVTAAVCSHDQTSKRVLLVDYHARLRQWAQVLEIARGRTPNPPFIQYQAARALYHRGRLCDELFSFPQYSGPRGLFMHGSLPERFPLRHSDLFFDLGLVNEAQHWAHEALSVTGDSAWNLQRLVWVNLLRDDRVVAAKFLGMLQKTLWHSTWARDHATLLSDRPASGSRLKAVKDNMPKSDFLVSPTEPERCLEKLIENTPNKMAFEYFMAHCLLEGDISGFMKRLHRLNDLGYTRIPRHFEEAILIYTQLTGRQTIPLPGRTLSPETVRRFNDFNRIVAKYNKNKNAAFTELLKYKDTYWFYGMYYYRPEES